jgi:hypothetical protein
LKQLTDGCVLETWLAPRRTPHLERHQEVHNSI